MSAAEVEVTGLPMEKCMCGLSAYERKEAARPGLARLRLTLIGYEVSRRNAIRRGVHVVITTLAAGLLYMGVLYTAGAAFTEEV